MLLVNNPAVNLETRTFIRRMMDEGLDEPCAALLTRALEPVRDTGPGGWVFLLADSLGATREKALAAASFCEMYYAMCSFTDDVQDDDATYMDDLDQAMRINTLAQLICATAVRGTSLREHLDPGKVLEALQHAFTSGVAMLTGQRIEILRQDWSIDAYRQVAILSGGRQFEVYLEMAALAADASPEPLHPLADPLATLVQIFHDERTSDERLLSLPPDDVAALKKQARQDLLEAARTVPERGRKVVDMIVQAATEPAP
jgi:hypothetical protein